MATSKAFCKRKDSKSRIESSTYLVREDDVIREVFRQQLLPVTVLFSRLVAHITECQQVSFKLRTVDLTELNEFLYSRTSLILQYTNGVYRKKKLQYAIPLFRPHSKIVWTSLVMDVRLPSVFLLSFPSEGSFCGTVCSQVLWNFLLAFQPFHLYHSVCMLKFIAKIKCRKELQASCPIGDTLRFADLQQ